MSEIFGAIGSIAAAKMQADAIKKATQMQIDALERQRAFVYSELDPSKIGGAAAAADIDRAEQRLALQSQTDPDLLAARYKAEHAILGDFDALGNPRSDVNKVSEQATQEALKGVPGMQEAKQQLVDAALKELSLGATLPPDVQAELVKSGLETSGMTTGAASPQGFGGQILRQILGTAGVALQKQRQDQAAGLLGQAQNLEQSRQSILGTLFPNLSATQLNTLKAKQGVLEQSNKMVPEVGLGGSDIANLWLARVGATNQLAQSAADAAARGATGQAQAWQTGFGAAIPYVAKTLPSTASVYNSMFGGASSGVDPAVAAYNPTGY